MTKIFFLRILILYGAISFAQDSIVWNSKKDKIYHMPGQRYYEQTLIRSEEGDKYFCTEQEAIEDGFRKSKS